MRTLGWGTVIAGALALVLTSTNAANASESITADPAPASDVPRTEVDGAVLDRDGHGVAGATVFARRVGTPGAAGAATRPFETLTDPRGRFHLDDLPPGTYWFIALHPQHPAGSSPALPVLGKLEVTIHLDEDPNSA